MNKDHYGRLTPSEKGLLKKCNDCKRNLPLNAFYVRDATRMTEDGRRYRMSRCAVCFGKLRKYRGNSEIQLARNRARIRAMRRFAADNSIAFQPYYDEELKKEGVL